MNTVTLSTGESVTIRDHAELTERLNRPVEVANTRASPVADKLREAKFEPEDKTTWGVLALLTLDEYNLLNAYKSAVIAAMVTEWPWDFAITDENSLDLPPAQFEELANLCNAAWRGDSIEIDPDPTPGGGDSTG